MKTRHSIRYLALNKPNKISDSPLEQVQEQNDEKVVEDDVGKMIPQAEDLPYLHLLNWVDEGSNVHILQYLANVLKTYKKQNAAIQKN